MEMEGYDPQLAAKVWRRVRPDAVEEDPVSLLAMVLRNARRYGELSRRLGSSAKKLADAKRWQADCLRGLWLLQSGEQAQVYAGEEKCPSVRIVLCRCLADELSLLKEYEQRMKHPQLGGVYQQLTMEQRSHCAMAARLLGSLKDDSLPQR